MRDVLVNVLLLLLEAGVALHVSRRRRFDQSQPLLVLVALGLAAAALGGMFRLMRVAAYVLFVHAPIGLALLAFALRRPAPRLALASGVGSSARVLVAIDAFIMEPRALEVNHVSIASAKVPRALRIAVISDIQFEDFGEHERRALTLAMEAKPDIVLFTGDYVQGRDRAGYRVAVAAMNAELRALHFEAPLGAYAVRGNVDDEEWPWIFDGTKVTVLPQSRTFTAGGISITSLDLEDSFDTKRPIAGAPGFHIVFGHGPDFALADVSADLLVAGHTHGGQVQLPWIGPLVTLARVPRAWASGATVLTGGRTLVVSRGIGMERGEAPRVRFLCKPELVLIDVAKVD